jgi:hypothetical protein
MYQLYQDAMSIVSYFGKPDLFVTFTCNPKWPKITRELLPYQNAVDRPDLTARVFHIKLQELLKDLLRNNCLGKIIAYIYVIEFQKHGLPHVHFLLILAPEKKLRSTDDYNSVVSAKIPNPVTHPLAYETVSTMMMHGPCGAMNPAAPCMKDGVCQNITLRVFVIGLKKITMDTQFIANAMTAVLFKLEIHFWTIDELCCIMLI